MPVSQHSSRPQLPSRQAETTTPIFVTGASRSGTTMLARMLGAHADVLALNELHYFGDLWEPGDEPTPLADARLTELAATLRARQDRGLWSGRASADELRWGGELVADLPAPERTPAGLFTAALDRLAAEAGKRRSCEQTPRNIFYAERLLALYPGARIVHIVRDPRAVLASQKNRWRLRRLGAAHLPRTEMLRNWVNYHPFTMSRLWERANAQALRLRGHPRFLLMRFEDLAARPEPGVERLCEFLGLAPEPAMLALPRWGSSNVRHSSERAGISTEVVEQWREVLSSGEIQVCEQVTRRLMQAFDYAPLAPDRPSRLAMLPSVLSYPLHAAGVLALNPGRARIQLRAMLRAARPSTAH